MSRHILKLLAIALLAGVISPATAQSNQAQVGMLTCKTSANVGLIVGSRQKLQCTFTPSSGGARDYYTGVPRGALAGRYGGASGEVSVGVGVGANALFGGSNRSIALQPVSVEGQIGANFALGVAALTLYGL